MQLLIYYCVLDTLGERGLSEDEIDQGQKMIKTIQKHLKWATKQRRKVVKRKNHAEQRLRDIPDESGAAKVKLGNVRKELEALEYKKSWSNLPKRSMLRGKIAFYQSKIGKLKAEKVLQKKVVEDSVAELKSFLIEITEAEVAIQKFE